MKIVLLIIWIIATLCLVASIIGMLLFVPDNYRRSTWMEIGTNLIDSIIRECDSKAIKKILKD